MSNLRSTIPKTWENEKLIEAVDYLSTGVPEYQGTKIYFSTGSVQIDKVEPEGEFACKNRPARANRLARLGDIIQARMKNTDKGLLIDGALDEQLLSTGFIQMRPFTGTFENKYLYFYVKSRLFLAQRDKNSSGSTQEAMTDAGAENITIPVAPLLEQKRIVSKLEELFSGLDASIDNLKRVQANLKRYRASVLKAACEGKLVPTEAELARKEKRTYEAGEQLLERIVVERRMNWQGRGKYIEATKPNTDNLKTLPNGWTWTTIGACFRVAVGATPSRKEPSYWGGKIPWVSSGEVSFRPILKTEETITQKGLDNSSTQLNPKGSVLIGMIGEGKTRGQTAILEIDACNNQNSAAIWVSQTPVPPEYVYYWLWSQYDNTRRTSSGNNQPALNKARVEAMLLPLPPFAEQVRIVADVERRLSMVDKLAVIVSDNLQRTERLRQSVLQKAFSGDLVAQDPSDEPASVLLEKIKAMREAEKVKKVSVKAVKVIRRPRAKKK